MQSGLVPHPLATARIATLIHMLPCVLLVAAALLAGSAQAEEWDYTFHGADWQGKCADGQKQSPIDINYHEVVPVSKDKPFKFINYDLPTPVRVSVGHHTVRATPTCDYEIAISGGGLPGRYILDHVHFHWGSEHLFNGYSSANVYEIVVIPVETVVTGFMSRAFGVLRKRSPEVHNMKPGTTVSTDRFPLEAHFVHYKSIYNGTADAVAQNDPEGIAVLGVMYVEAKKNLELYKIEQGAQEGQTTLDLENLLPVDKSLFFRYRGSLTTPGCSESVLWTIFKMPATISPFQVAELRGLMPEEEQIIPTWREVQPLNRRTVELWSTTSKNILGLNKVHNISPNPSLLFAVLPGLSNSLHNRPLLRRFI